MFDTVDRGILDRVLSSSVMLILSTMLMLVFGSSWHLGSLGIVMGAFLSVAFEHDVHFSLVLALV